MPNKDIKFLRFTHLRGPNIWTYRPVLEAWIDIGDLEDHPSNTLPGFVDRLVAWLPSLIEHRCSYEERGGFVRRLQEGTWPGHILEHVTLELQNQAGMQCGFGKARETSQRGIYKVVVRTRDAQVGRAAMEAARELILAAIDDQPYDVAATVARLAEMVDDNCLGPSTACIVDAATARGIPSIRLTDGNLVQLGYGSRQRRVWTAETDRTSAIAESIASDKDLTKRLLESCGVPVPEGQIVASAEAAWEAAQDIGLPVVVKPSDANHGRGVSLELHERADIEAAFAIADAEGSDVIVERFVRGEEHRLLVVGGKVVAAARGESLWITGDGTASVLQLIDSQLNSDPRRGEAEEFPLETIVLDREPAMRLLLSRQGMTGESIPAPGQRVLIQRNGNVAIDVTAQVHPLVAARVSLAARIVGLDIAGVDLVAEDIARPLEDQGGAIVEVNAGPGLLMHLKPASGTPQPVGEAIVEHLFPQNESGRIPVIGIAGTGDSTRIARLLSWLLQMAGRHVGVACRDGLFLDQRAVQRGNCANWTSGQRMLMNRAIDAAIFDNNAELILGEGLAYDRCTIGIVTDMRDAGGLTQYDVHDHDGLYKALRTQVDVVLPEGIAVLNADDERVREMADLCDGSVILFSALPEQAAIQAHRAAGGRMVLLREGSIWLADGRSESLALDASLANRIAPETLLAALAAAWAFGISPDLMRAGVSTFEPAVATH